MGLPKGFVAQILKARATELPFPILHVIFGDHQSGSDILADHLVQATKLNNRSIMS